MFAMVPQPLLPGVVVGFSSLTIPLLNLLHYFSLIISLQLLMLCVYQFILCVCSWDELSHVYDRTKDRPHILWFWTGVTISGYWEMWDNWGSASLGSIDATMLSLFRPQFCKKKKNSHIKCPYEISQPEGNDCYCRSSPSFHPLLAHF